MNADPETVSAPSGRPSLEVASVVQATIAAGSRASHAAK